MKSPIEHVQDELREVKTILQLLLSQDIYAMTKAQVAEYIVSMQGYLMEAENKVLMNIPTSNQKGNEY